MNTTLIMSSEFSHSRGPRGRNTQRGVALIITLLILGLMTVLSLGMVIAFSSQTLIGGFYRNYRGAFYAADSGLNIARDQVVAQLEAGVPASFPTNLATITNATACGPTSGVTVGSSTYNTPTSLNTGTAAQSWNENFKITNVTLTMPAAPTIGVNTYTCGYTYSITSVGSAQGSEQQTVTETGNINMVVNGQAAVNNVSFAYFGGFVDYYQHGIGPLVPGTMTGPMFTNTAWEFMASIPPWTAPYIFTDPVGQVESQADFWDSGWGQHWVAGSSYGSGSNLVAPTFQDGFNLNQTAVPLPTNSFNQLEAVIDGAGNAMTQAQTTTAMAGLVNPTGQTYSASGGAQGVYYNKGTTSGSSNSFAAGVCALNVPTPCIAGGGFYIEGTADVQLIPSGATAQIYKVTQNGVLTTITIDPAANNGIGTTVIATTSGSQTLNGVPYDTVTSQASTMVYVDGTMYFHGPGEGQGAIQDNAMITLTAYGDAIATGDVLYKTEPVSIPQDALIPAAANMNQVLGIFTAVGNFITQTNQADQNIEVDGSIATISTADSANNCAAGKGGQLSYGHINTFNNVGGMIQSCIYGADINAENTWFDRRFTARNGFAPPWFPSTSITTGGALPANPTPQVQRVQWLSTSSQ
jgi:Tfp pilus assembly protein PilX